MYQRFIRPILLPHNKLCCVFECLFVLLYIVMLQFVRAAMKCIWPAGFVRSASLKWLFGVGTFSFFSIKYFLLFFSLSAHIEKRRHVRKHMSKKNCKDKTRAERCRVEKSETWRQQSNVREERLWRRGEFAGSLCFTTEYLPWTSFSLFQLSPPKTDLCRQEGGTQLRPWMSPTGPVSLDKQLDQCNRSAAVSEILRPALSSRGSSSCSVAIRNWGRILYQNKMSSPGENTSCGFIADTFSTSQMVLWNNQASHHKSHSSSMPSACHIITLTHPVHITISMETCLLQVHAAMNTASLRTQVNAVNVVAQCKTQYNCNQHTLATYLFHLEHYTFPCLAS